MVEGKPYRYGLIVAGLCVAAVGLFIMVQERPHIYGTLCALGVIMVVIGTAWSLCQCYPKVMLVPQNEEEKRFEDSVYSSAEAKQRSSAEALPRFSGEEADSRLLNKALSSRCHSCPTLHLLAQPDQDLPAGDVPLDRRRAPYLLAQVPGELP